MTIEEFISQLGTFFESITHDQWIYWVGGTAAAYIIGSISFAHIASKAKGVNLREQGSGNLGATNVFRAIGPRAGITVFILDVLKGLLPALVACVLVGLPENYAFTKHLKFLNPLLDYWQHITIWNHLADGWRNLAITYGVAAIIGHMYPFYLGFRGGKAVATGCGVFLVIAPLPTLTAIFIWILVLFVGRYVSLASMVAAVALFVQILLAHLFKDDDNILQATTWLAGLVCLMVIIRHRSNIVRIIKGTENRIAAPEKKRRKPPAGRAERRSKRPASLARKSGATDEPSAEGAATTDAPSGEDDAKDTAAEEPANGEAGKTDEPGKPSDGA